MGETEGDITMVLVNSALLDGGKLSYDVVSTDSLDNDMVSLIDKVAWLFREIRSMNAVNEQRY